MNQEHVQELQDVVIRFSGDSGDGMQLPQDFLRHLGVVGNGISDYPAEIRAREPWPEYRASRSFSAHGASWTHTATYW